MRRLLCLIMLFGLATLSQGATPTGEVAVQQTANQVRFTIITQRGYVHFSTGADWTVLTMQTRAPVTASVFQIPDPADEGTPDSTNVIVSLYSPQAEQAKKAMAIIGKRYGEAPVTTEAYKHWTLFRQQSKQGLTSYTVIDAKADVADVICGVRLAWPHLTNHPADYDARMEAVLRSLLDSIEGDIGEYKPQSDEVVRRPTDE